MRTTWIAASAAPAATWARPALDEGVDVGRAGRSGGSDRRGLGGEDPPPCPDAP
ncbi:MAG TPA: hypothetical protein VNO54_23850 [Streptosporangiaceae bacterium]|nr:hypothetical protein [Streptosporangiaceae bacterium]